jgi:hypothetical protein
LALFGSAFHVVAPIGQGFRDAFILYERGVIVATIRACAAAALIHKMRGLFTSMPKPLLMATS